MELAKIITIWAIPLLEREVFGSQYVIDIGCGGGATTALFAQRFPAVDFLGIDTEEQLISFAP